MSEVYRLDGPTADATAAAERALSGGGLAVFPTDTVYGIAARPDLPAATGRLFTAKRRSRRLAIPLLVPETEEAEAVAVLDGRARALAVRFWPGALTLVLPRNARSLGWDLGDERESVGVRVPDHDVARALLERMGALAVTSANRSGAPEAATCEEVIGTFGDEIAVYLCGGPAAGLASTVVDLTGPQTRVLRVGAVPPEAVLRVSRGAGAAPR